MRALRSFTVRPRLPEALAPVEELAMNLRWSWDQRTRDVFRWIDPDAWDASGRDPIRLLGLVERRRLDELAADTGFMRFLGEVHDGLRRHLTSTRWFQGRKGSPLRRVAYFSPEFGIAEALPQYSGGLGVLAGDHLKAASGLGVPLLGVGLLYRYGYFRQELDADGWQQERYVDVDPYGMPLTPLDLAPVLVDLAGTPVAIRVWRAEVGRVTLYLLDTGVETNDAEGRYVTDRLYGGDVEHRLRQEIVLGIGGTRVLEALGEDVQVFHSNEGHAGFLGLERIRRAMADDVLSFAEAIEAVRAGTVFTTHTPVSAGIDRFPRELMERYFKGWSDECQVPFDDLMSLGHEPGEPPDAPFNMAVMGLRLAGRSNGVSRLHGATSRRMFASLWPDLPVEDVPIGHVTNGVHAHTWVAPEMVDLLGRYVLPEWQEAGPDRWAGLDDDADDELWRVRETGRERLVTLVRARLRAALLTRGLSQSDVAWCDDALDPRVLTIGFARRFATYKRGTLLLSQPERLEALLLSETAPVQLIFAGKAHPADDSGKQIIREIVAFASRAAVRHRIAFVEDYDIGVARAMYQGCDVWLNTPRRPMEACGTSGEKAALNGALNCSILDGWWDEMFDGENGWAISSAEGYDDLNRRDQVEAASLFDLLENQIVPCFYERDDSGVSREWVTRVRASLVSLGPRVTASRMVRDYVEQLYEPTAERADAFGREGRDRARAVAKWKRRVVKAWDGVAVSDVTVEPAEAELGSARSVRATVELGKLAPDDVQVQLLHGTVAANEELVNPSTVPMTLAGPGDAPATHSFDGSFTCERAGRYGFTVRVVPAHPDLTTYADLGLVTWAQP